MEESLSEDTTIERAGPQGFSIDPSTWSEPVIKFPGLVVRSTYRWCDEKYLDVRLTTIGQQANRTREYLEASLKEANPQGEALIPQWDLRVKRLDEGGILSDGSLVDFIRYGGYDLVTWDQRESKFGPVRLNQGKAAFISNEWKRVAGSVHPPENLEGKMFNFDFWPTKRFGGSMPAKNVLIPTAILPPTYVFAGEVRLVTIPDREADTGAAGATEEAPTLVGTPATITDYEALAKLIYEVLPGRNAKDAAGIMQALPPELRITSILMGVSSGEILKTLEAQGKITIDTDGTIRVA